MFYIYLLLFLSIAISGLSSLYIRKKYNDYLKIASKKGLSGVEVAQEILKANGIDNVYVVETTGYLSDHFDAKANVVRLSSAVFHGESISSASIAAHEVGHAIQYKEGNAFMKIRSFLFPFVNLCSKVGYAAILIGVFAQFVSLYLLGIVLLSTILIFQLITLPVEFDASGKGLENIEKLGILNADEQKGARSVLIAAALTYVAGLITSLLEIARLLLNVMGDRK